MRTLAPATPEEATEIINEAAESGQSLWFAGSGSVPPCGDANVMLSTGVSDIVDWQVADLTVVVGAGVGVGDLETELATHNQTSLLPTEHPNRTVGGLIAEGESGLLRLRHGPTRDRVLEVTMATGYGQVVKGGGRLVKNVTGYDLPRLVTGSHGALGWVSQVCLKLWPMPQTRRAVRIEDPGAALTTLYRPGAILETESGSLAFLEGSESDVAAQMAAVGATQDADLPTPIDSDCRLSVRVPARLLPSTLDRVRSLGPDRFVAQHGVGMIEAGWEDLSEDALGDLRTTVAADGGAVVVRSPDPRWASVDRWGMTPSTFAIQRRLKELFDPVNVCNPGVLPGGL